jgi:hypothetical protein
MLRRSDFVALHSCRRLPRAAKPWIIPGAMRSAESGNYKGDNDMKPIVAIAAFAALAAAADAQSADRGPVTWIDPSCGYFIIQLPEGNPAEAFGLFSSKTKPIPKVGDVLEGDIVSAYEVEATDVNTGQKHPLLHWANAKSPEMLIRNAPVQCASRWKKKD